jgi:hypothetical protein
MTTLKTNRLLPVKPRFSIALAGILIGVAIVFYGRTTQADFATPFVEINNHVGDISEARGFVVARCNPVEECSHFIVIVSTDRLTFVTIGATAESDVVKNSLVGRPVIIKAEVIDDIENGKPKMYDQQLKILSVRAAEE